MIDHPQLSSEEYLYFAEIAKSTGLISTIRPYDSCSNVVDRIQAMIREQHTFPGWYDYLYESNTEFNDVAFDNKFCQLLQAGIEGPLFALLFTLLPQVSEIVCRGGPHSGQHLQLLLSVKPDHCFSALKRLTIGSTDGGLEWPLSTFTQLLSPNLQELQCYMASEWDKEITETPWNHRPFITPVVPRSLNITHLMLHYCGFSAAGIIALLHDCRSLAWLYYSAGGYEVGPHHL